MSHPPLRCLVIAGMLAALSGHVSAQGAPLPGVPASAPSERVKREAEKVFQWIRMHSDKPRRAATPAKPVASPAAPMSVPVKAAHAPEARVTDSGIREIVQPLGAAAPGAGTSARAADTAPAARRALAAGPERQPAAIADTASASSAPPADAPAAQTTALSPPVDPPQAEEPDEEDPRLTVVHRPDPEFPRRLMENLRRGSVRVSFTVEPSGAVVDAKAEQASHPRLVRTALDTVSQWRFEPVARAQQAVVEIGFNLD